MDLVRSSASVTPRASINEGYQSSPQYAQVSFSKYRFTFHNYNYHALQGLATVGFSIDPNPPYRIADITEGSSVQARDFQV